VGLELGDLRWGVLAISQVERDSLLKSLEQLVERIARGEHAGELWDLGPVGALLVVDASGALRQYSRGQDVATG
jgi:hypothetical protein